MQADYIIIGAGLGRLRAGQPGLTGGTRGRGYC